MSLHNLPYLVVKQSESATKVTPRPLSQLTVLDLLNSTELSSDLLYQLCISETLILQMLLNLLL